MNMSIYMQRENIQIQNENVNKTHTARSFFLGDTQTQLYKVCRSV